MRACRPATFHLQGLATLLAASSLRIRAGFVSHRQRSWDSPFGAFPSRKVPEAFPHRVHPRTVSPASAPAAEAVGRPNGPRFLGFDPSESPSRPSGGLVRRTPDAPLGLALPGFSIEGLGQRFRRPPLTRFVAPAANHRTDRRPRVSISLRPSRSRSRAEARQQDRATLLGFLHRPDPVTFGHRAPLAMCSPRTGPTLPPTRPCSSGVPLCPTGVAGIG
jgi:hypothetical protein